MKKWIWDCQNIPIYIYKYTYTHRYIECSNLTEARRIFMMAYRFHLSCFCEIWALCVSWITYDHLYYKYISHLKNIDIRKVLCLHVNYPIKSKQEKSMNPDGNYIFKVNNRNTRRCEICSKLTIKTPKWHQASFWCFYCVNF